MSEAFELIKQRFELNENYHNSKESMAWLGSTIYYGFCTSIISILMINTNTLDLIHMIILLVASAAVFIGAISFINLQFRMRWQSNDINSALVKIFNNFNPKSTVQQYMKDLDKYKKEFARKRCKSQIFVTTIFWPLLFWRIYKMPSEYIPKYHPMALLFIF